MKLISLPAAVLATALSLAGAASAAGPLAAPPPPSGPTANTIFDAMLAIARATTSNPAAAQAATFSYNAAIQQYNIHDYARARMSALNAISQAGAPGALPAPLIMTQPPRAFPTFYPAPPAVGADEADAENYVALARRALTMCGAPGKTPPALQQQYKTAVDALVAKKYAAAEGASRSIVEQCSAAAQALAASTAGVPLPTATPLPLNYSPLPVATLIPDPALLQTPMPLMTATPGPTRRR
jgi:hypothetical protein